MKYHLHINQKAAIEMGIKNINQAHIFDLLTTCSVWAEPIIIEGEVYYWSARQTIAEELLLLNLKSDTIYRHLKILDELGLILYRKSGKKDCIKITNKGKKYHSNTMSEMNPNHYIGNESEKIQNSEINPTKLGNESEKHSDLNPTYHTTNINHTTNISKQEKNKNKNSNFSLTKLTAYENLSAEYKTKLKDEILKLNLSLDFETFKDALIAKGYKYKNFVSAYKQWDKNNFNSKNKQVNQNTFDLSDKKYKKNEEF